MWVQWDTRDIRALLPSEIAAHIGEAGVYRVALRLRESHALELQQKLLASLGRVGLLAVMPATFPVNVAAYSFDASQKANRLQLPTLDHEGGVCYTGRDDKGEELCKLVLTERAIDELLDSISNLEEAAINPRALETLRRLKTAPSLASELQLGLKVPTSDKSGFKELKSLAKNEQGQSVDQTIGMIARNPLELKLNQPKHGGFVLVLTDPLVQQTVNETAAPANIEHQTTGEKTEEGT
jgi:hypothetical protein